MQNLNTQSTLFSLKTLGLCILSLLLVFSMSPISAFAVTSAEKYAEADEILERIDAMQTELSAAKDDYEVALEANEAATIAMGEAQERIDAAVGRIDELQERLGARAAQMYKNGRYSFLDVFLGSTTFEEFLTNWDMVELINAQDANLVQETKDVRSEAEDARQEYSDQKDLAAAKMEEADALAKKIEATQASLKEEAQKITAEADALAAEEAAAAEAAALAAEEAARAAAAAAGSNYSQPGQSVVSGSGILAHPCPSGYVSSTYGPRWGRMHNGVDFAAGEGAPYYAADSGTVISATYDGGYNGGAGNWIRISHGNGIMTTYMHSSAVYVSVGDQVSRGQNIGAVGNTGNSTGPHLHFEVSVNGSRVDPMTYI